MTRLPAGWSSISMPGSPSSSSSTLRCRPLPPGKSVPATSSKWRSTSPSVSSKRRSTVSASSSRSASSSASERSRSSRCSRQLLEPRLLARVLLGRERVHLAERLAAPLQPLELGAELVGLLVLRERLGLGVLGEPAQNLLALGLEPRALDPDRGERARRPRPPRGAARPRALRGGAAPRRARPPGCRPRRRAPAAGARAGARPLARRQREPRRRAPRCSASCAAGGPRGVVGSGSGATAAASAANQLSPPESATSASRRSRLRLLETRDGLCELDLLGRPRARGGQGPLVARRLRRRSQARPVGVGAQAAAVSSARSRRSSRRSTALRRR